MTKKRGQIRMVIDCRGTNRSHNVPPHAALGTAAALAEQSFSESSLLAVGAKKDSHIWGGAPDLRDSFYQFSCQEIWRGLRVGVP